MSPAPAPRLLLPYGQHLDQIGRDVKQARIEGVPHLSSPVFKVPQHLPRADGEGCLDAVVRGSGHRHDAAHAATGRTSSGLGAGQAAGGSTGLAMTQLTLHALRQDAKHKAVLACLRCRICFSDAQHKAVRACLRRSTLERFSAVSPVPAAAADKSALVLARIRLGLAVASHDQLPMLTCGAPDGAHKLQLGDLGEEGHLAKALPIKQQGPAVQPAGMRGRMWGRPVAWS